MTRSSSNSLGKKVGTSDSDGAEDGSREIEGSSDSDGWNDG